MRNTLLRMLGVLLCALAACADNSTVADFSLEKMAGKWYSIGMASNAEWFVNKKAIMKQGITTMNATEGGDLDLTYASLKADGTCYRMTHLAKKTETPGRFTFHSKIWNNDNDMRITDVVYDNYAIAHTIKTKDGESEFMKKLYSRTPETSEELHQKFRNVSIADGILVDNIVILPLNAECPAE